MRSKKWKQQREFSTETLTQVEVDEIMAESGDYAEGKAPVSRNTQYAESLDDMDKLQRSSHRSDEFSKTHNYGVLQAVRDYNPVEAEIGDAPAHEIPSNREGIANEFISRNALSGAIEPDYSSAYSQDDESNDVAYAPYTGEDSDFYTQLGDEGSFSLQPLTPEDDIYEDIMEKFTSAPTKPKYWFKEQGDHWFCSCGQLNKGDFCTNCGLERDLLRTLFVLHEPNTDSSKYSSVSYTEVDMPSGKLSVRAKLLIAIAAIIILLAGTGLFSYFKIIKPSMEEEAAANEKAAAASLQTNIIACGSNMNSFMRNSYITAGDDAFEGDKFETAIRFYGLAQAIEDSDELQGKLNKSKYAYVLANKASGGEKFEKYLMELWKIGYSDIDKVYHEYFAWQFKIIANTSPEDDVTDLSTVSRADTVFFHVFTSGGAPDETIDIYYEATWPSGAKQTEQLGQGWKAGSKASARFSYPVPRFGREGTLTFKIFDNNTQELLGSDTVNFKK